MPDIYVSHRERVGLGGRDSTLYDSEGVQRFVEKLRTECAMHFTVPELPLGLYDFDIYDRPLRGFSDQAKDVIIRIDLHDFPTRLASAEQDANELMDVFTEFFNTPVAVQWRGRVSVGIRLVFTEVVWAASA